MYQKINKQSIIMIFFCCFSFTSLFAQTAIGKNEVEGKDVILDFKEDDNRGMILSWVNKDSDIISPVGGTMIYDSNEKKVKYYRAGNTAGWVDLSINPGTVDLSIHESLAENYSPTIIGKDSSTAKGVLILEATDKAMVLPKSKSPHLNIKSPASGTIAYDTISKMLCVFNGEEWSFWKVED